MKINWFLLSVIYLLLLFSFNSFAEDSYRIVDTESSIKVTGSSTLHDWHMELKKMNCEVKAVLNEKQNLIVSAIDFSCLSTAIKSESSMMDNKAYEALKVDKYKNITFNSNGKSELIVNGGTLKGPIPGELFIAGSNKKINIPFDGEIDGNTIKLEGAVKVKMSEYGITPPTAMMGTIKTGDEITIHYHLVFKK
jgi:hypothetical protein